MLQNSIEIALGHDRVADGGEQFDLFSQRHATFRKGAFSKWRRSSVRQRSSPAPPLLVNDCAGLCDEHNNADDLLATDQRNRQERFVGVFWRGGKGLKARVFPGARRQRHNRLVFRSPSRYAFSDPQITKSESYIFV